MYWKNNSKNRWEVLKILPPYDPNPHKRKRRNDYDPTRANQLAPGPDYEPKYDYHPAYAADDDDGGVIVAVENDTETKRMKDMRVSCQNWYEFKRSHALIKRGWFSGLVKVHGCFAQTIRCQLDIPLFLITVE